MSGQYEVKDLSPKEIYSDDDFNCRGPIAPMDVADLAKSIRDKGLQFPISVQPAADVKGGLPAGYNYRIVAGHRRFKACCILEMKTVPSMIKVGLSEANARLLNLSENLDRKELNILQEARAIEALHNAGIPRDDVARQLGKSSSWVQVRYYLLRMPNEIQEEAAAGMINQFQIKQLYSLASDEARFEAVKKIKDAKMKGEVVPQKLAPRKATSIDVKRRRDRDEMFDMIEIIGKAVGYGLQTRALAWASGEISSKELFDDIKIEADKLGNDFFPPLEF